MRILPGRKQAWPLCDQQYSRSRQILQPLTWCRDSRLRCGWRRGRDARASGRFQRVL